MATFKILKSLFKCFVFFGVRKFKLITIISFGYKSKTSCNFLPSIQWNLSCPDLRELLLVLSEDMNHEQEQVIVVHTVELYKQNKNTKLNYINKKRAQS